MRGSGELVGAGHAAFSPAELVWWGLVGPGRLELPTSRLSGVRSNQAELRAYGRTTAGQQRPGSRSHASQARPVSGAARHEIGKRNEDGGEPHFIGTSITNLVRALLETYP